MDTARPQKRQKVTHLLQKFENDRRNVAESVVRFKISRERVRLLRNTDKIKRKCKGLLYWMFRDVRIQDNWAVLLAQKAALKNCLPLHICYCVPPVFLDTTLRHYKFLIKGLMEVETECKKLNINFHLLHGEPSTAILNFVSKYKMGALITDFMPLNLPMSWVNALKDSLPKGVPLCQVDAHNIVPCWHASPKLEYSAQTIRHKIYEKLGKFLTEFPPVIQHTHTTEQEFDDNDWEGIWDTLKVHTSVDEITWAKPGYIAGIKQLENFVNERLENYGDKRNDPVVDGISNLSPWFHFGMISVQRCILEVNRYKHLYSESVRSFIEEAVIRRELSDNFCFYNEKYDSVDGASNWALETLTKHSKDKRQYTYTLHQLEFARTHDDLWNACQNQMVFYGKMHGYLRMYWAKKILEYTETPQQALEWTIYLNNRYSIDGADPNGYVGCMWSICGVHDRGWRERDVFGKIRYMNYEGCKRKFNVAEFVSKWGNRQRVAKK